MNQRVSSWLCLVVALLVSCSFYGCRNLGATGATPSVSGGGTSGGTSGGGTTGGGTTSGTTGGTTGGTPTTAELLSISTNGTTSAVAVGASGTILQSTHGTSGTTVFPTWTSTTSPVSSNLRGVSFDLSTAGSIVMAVGDSGAMLQNVSGGTSGWVSSIATIGFSLTDTGCPANSSTSFSPNLFGVSIFASNSQPAVVVGGPDSCNKGVITVATSSVGTLPFNGWVVVDKYSNGGPLVNFPAVTFRGVSFSQNSFTSSSVVLVVGDSGNIFAGNAAGDLTNPNSWSSELISGGPTLNAVAVSNNTQGIAVGTGGAIYVNPTVPSTAWTRLSTGVPVANYTGVHFVAGSTITAIVVGSSPPTILQVSNCCGGSSTVTNVTPTITGLGNIDAVWGVLGTPALALASGGGGYILESDNGGSTTAWTRTH